MSKEKILRVIALNLWWILFLLAAWAYWYLTTISVGVTPPAGVNAIHYSILQTFSRGAWLFSGLIFLVGLICAFRAQESGRLLDTQSSLDTIKDLSWRKFEALLAEAYRRQGYEVQENLKAGPDGGVDVRLTKDGEQTLVQCKRWKVQGVGVTVVRELFGVMASEKAENGIVVTVGYFTPDALKFAEKHPNVDLVDGQKLIRLIGRIHKGDVFEQEGEAPDCPKCKSPMILRTAKKGKNEGRQFWGCGDYPRCRGTRAYDK